MVTDQELTDCLKQLRSRLFKTIFNLVKDYHKTEDILQQTFLRCWKYKSNDVRELENWVFRVCYNCIKDHKKSKWERNAILFSNCNHSLEPYVSQKLHFEYNLSEQEENKEYKKIIKNEIEKLSAGQKEVLLLKEHMTFQEISQKCKIPIGTVKTRARLATIKLKKIINKKTS